VAQRLDRRTPTHFAPCAPEPWTTPLGYVPPRIFWTRNKQPWVVLPDERNHFFETQPDDLIAFFNSVVANPHGATA
jgi:hypothetical protein